jgi:hypothetical protein
VGRDNLKRRISMLLKKSPSLYAFVKKTNKRCYFILNKITNYYFEKRRFKKKLGKQFNFVRVDFYSLEDRIYIGELTHYPESGTGRINPKEYDFRLGEYWKFKT